jgi:CzcA family heavy metal efflux pump
MSFNEWIHKHTRAVLFVMAALALAGGAAAFILPVSLFPRSSWPRVEVTVNSGSRTAKIIAVQVTYPIEKAIRAILGVQRVTSTTSRGTADIYADFGWGKNMVQALTLVQSAVNTVLPSLPAGTTAVIRLRNPSNYQIISYSLTSKTVSPSRLRRIGLFQIRPLLLGIGGVARIGVEGGRTREYHVIINPAKLAAFNLSINDVARAVAANNIFKTSGKMQDHDKLYFVVSDSRFHNVRQIGRIAVRTGGHGVVHLRDVADVKSSFAPVWTRATANGKPAVLIDVYQQPDGNTVQIINRTRAEMKKIKSKLPAGVAVKLWYNQGHVLMESAVSVRDAVIVGIVMAVLVLLVFLRNWKTTLMAASVVPAALATTVLLLYLLNMSFNIMTLGGMAAAVGLIIDDAIVMIEHIIRRVGEKGGTYRDKIIRASAEFTSPLAGSSASTIIIFAPLAFWSGLVGEFFKALSFTMAAALLASFVLSWLVVPVLAARMIREKDTMPHELGRITRNIHAGYEWIVSRLISWPPLVLLIVVPVLVAGYLAYQNVGSGFMPDMDEGGFSMEYIAPSGGSLTETDRLLRQVGKILRANPNVATYSRRTGMQLGGSLTESYAGDYYVQLKPFPRPPIEQVMDKIAKEIHHRVPSLYIDPEQLMQDQIGDLTAVPQPIRVEIFSDHQSVLDHEARKVLAAIEKVNGVADARSGVVVAGDSIYVKINSVAAGIHGITPKQVSRFVHEYVYGTVATRIRRGPQMIGVRVWAPRDMRRTLANLENLWLRSPKGRRFRLSSVAQVQIRPGEQEIDHINLKRMIAVTARIHGRDMGSTMVDVKKALNRPGLFPKGVYYRLGGLYRQQQIAFRGLVVVMLGGVVLVFLLLLFLYESFGAAIAMMIIPLLALACVFVGLWITHTQLNISSMMGMTMVVGIVTEVTIFYYSEYHELRDHEHGAGRLIQAGKNRMRPIAMTTIAAILALLPLALVLSPGAAMQQPLAIAIISGLLVQMPLTLLLLPVLLGFLHEEREGAPIM